MFFLMAQHTLICNECQLIYPRLARLASDLCDVLSSDKCAFDTCLGLASVIYDSHNTARVGDLTEWSERERHNVIQHPTSKHLISPA